MGRKIAVFFALAVALLMVSVPISAHHGRVGYDTGRVLTVKATVTSFEFINPHVQLHFDAPDEKGVMRHWDVEAENPYGAMRSGWTKDSFKPGDKITITFTPAKNGNPVGSYTSAITASGKKLVGGGGGGAPGVRYVGGAGADEGSK